MPKRFFVHRRHIIVALDSLLLQLNTMSFFVSPSLLLFVCRLVAQFVSSNPRELDSRRALRFFYLICLLLNLPSICAHLRWGAVEGRAVILDFIGVSIGSSKFQLCCLDLFIVLIQLLLTTVSYGTSLYHATGDIDATDLLLPHPPESAPNPLSAQIGPSIILSQQTKPFHGVNLIPIVIDLRLDAVTTHFHNAPLPIRRARYGSLLPLPNVLSNARTFSRPDLMQVERHITGDASGEMAMPGALDTRQDR